MDKSLSPNHGHGNFLAVAVARKKARELARMAAFVETRRPDWGGNLDKCHAGYSLYIMYNYNYNTDVDNIAARCKSYLDGLCEVAGINDRDINILITQKQKARRGEDGVYMSLTDFDLNQIYNNDGKELF